MVRDAVAKVFFDQVIFAPILIGILLSTFGFSQGMGKSEVKEKLKAVSCTITTGVAPRYT